MDIVRVMLVAFAVIWLGSVIVAMLAALAAAVIQLIGLIKDRL